MHSSDTNLFFDADYTTRAIAIGVMPTREYVTVGQLQDRYLDPAEDSKDFQAIPKEDFEAGSKAGWASDIAHNDPGEYERLRRDDNPDKDIFNI